MSEEVSSFTNALVTATPVGTTATLELRSIVEAKDAMGTHFWNFTVVSHPDRFMVGLSPRGLAIKDPGKLAEGMERNITVRNVQNLLTTLMTPQALAQVKPENLLAYLTKNCLGKTIQAKIEIKAAKDTGTLFNNIYPQAVKAK
jgi:hypothetical protein